MRLIKWVSRRMASLKSSDSRDIYFLYGKTELQQSAIGPRAIVVDARTRPATPVEPLGRRESDKRRVKEGVCGGMRCIDLSNRAWPVTGQGATTFARYLKFRVLFLKSLREKKRKLEN